MPRKSRKRTSGKKKSEPKEKLPVENEINNKKSQSGKNSTEKQLNASLKKEIQNKINSTDLTEEKSIADLGKLINQLRTEKQNLEQNLEIKEELIKRLKKKLLNYQQKTSIIENTSSDIEETERLRDSVLIMSQFIADKMGFTQGQVLEKFGMVDA